MMKRYCLEIYAPDNVEDVLYVLESDSPFLSIGVGESIHPGSLSGLAAEVGPYTLRVTGVQHILLDGAEVGHKVCIYTTRGSHRTVNDPSAHFSKKDRWLFAQVLRLLEAHLPPEAADLAQHRTALEEGYELHFALLEAIASAKMPEARKTAASELYVEMSGFSHVLKSRADSQRLGRPLVAQT
jgi:hypothetical protein